MTKIFFTIVIVVFFECAQAQTFKFSAGYGFPWVSQQIGVTNSSRHVTTLDPTTGLPVNQIILSNKEVRGSYGSGLVINGSYGYTLSENVGFELGLSYVLGKSYTTSSTYLDKQFDVITKFSSESEMSQSKTILFTPTLKFITSPRIITPYVLFGPVFGKVAFHRERERLLQENGNNSSESQYIKYSGGISIGLRGGVGVSAIVSAKIRLFTEVIFTGMKFSPKKSEIARYVINGEDKLNSLSRNTRITVYEKEVIQDSNGQHASENSSGKAVRFSVPMSSLTTNVGVLISIH